MIAPAIVGVDQEPSGCWVACISTITGIPLDQLPKASWFESEDEFLKRKLWIAYHNTVIKELGKLGWAVAYLGPRIPGGYAVASGPSPRHPDDENFKHAVVVYDGLFCWDPHPSREFIPHIDEYEVLVQLARPYCPVESWANYDPRV